MSFDELYNTFYPKIYRLCFGYLNDVEQAKDLVQETFISVWENLPQFRQNADIGTWIYRIAVNKCLRQITVDKRMPTTEISSMPDVADSVNYQEAQFKFLQQCIASLPEMERIIIGLVLENIPQEKIAEIVGISHENVRVKVHRIKRKLTKKIQGNEEL